MASASELQMIPLVRLTSDQFQAARRRGRVVQWLGAFFAWLLLATSIYLLFWFDHPEQGTLAQRATLASPLTDLIVVVAMLITPATVHLFLVFGVPSRDRWFGSHTLRGAILAGESTQIPAAVDQSSLPPSDGVFPDAADLKYLRILDFGDGGAVVVLVLVNTVIIFLMAFVVATLWLWLVGLPPDASTSGESLGVQGALAFLQIALALFIAQALLTANGGFQVIPAGWRLLLPSPRPKLLAIDEQGIHLRPRGWRRRDVTLAWRDARAFCVSRGKSGVTSESSYTYLLLGDDQSLAWNLSQRVNEDALDVLDLLRRVVMKHTQLPLLDITLAISSHGRWDVSPTLLHQFSTSVAASSPRHEIGQRMSDDIAMASEMAPLHRATLDEATRSSDSIRPVRLHPAFYWANMLAMAVVVSGLINAWSMGKL